ncbi:hypothetical protein ACOSQ4_005378 [Xanthoceras sorbifolium]
MLSVNSFKEYCLLVIATVAELIQTQIDVFGGLMVILSYKTVWVSTSVNKKISYPSRNDVQVRKLLNSFISLKANVKGCNISARRTA